MKNKNIFHLISIFCITLYFDIFLRPVIQPYPNGIDIGAAANDKSWNVGFLYNQYLKVDRKGVFQVGWGIRGSQFQTNTLAYTTAPSKLTKQE